MNLGREPLTVPPPGARCAVLGCGLAPAWIDGDRRWAWCGPHHRLHVATEQARACCRAEIAQAQLEVRSA